MIDLSNIKFKIVEQIEDEWLSTIFDDDNTIKPLYSLPQEVKNKEFSKIVQKAYIYLDDKNYFEEVIPDIFREKYHLISRIMAYYNAHFPSSTEEFYLHFVFQITFSKKFE